MATVAARVAAPGRFGNRFALAAAGAVAAGAMALWLPDSEEPFAISERVAALTRAADSATALLRWQWVVVVAVMACAHYGAAACAARAASGIRLPMRENLLVQMAASAANRLTPAGLGGAAVNARYFTRRGLRRSTALGAVGSLAVLGAPADLLVLAALAGLGSAFHLGVGAHQLRLVASRLSHRLAFLTQPWFWSVAGAAVLVAVVVVTVRRRSARRDTAGSRASITQLLRKPGRLAVVLASSGATTLVLAVAFAAAAHAIPGARPGASIAMLMISFMVASAAGAAIPTPANIGSTEAALTLVLVGLGETTTQALAATLLFRIVTFWTPAAVGLLAARTLRHRGAL